AYFEFSHLIRHRGKNRFVTPRDAKLQARNRFESWIAFLQHLADDMPASALSQRNLQINAVVSRSIEQLAICRFSRANTCERRTLKAIEDERCDDLTHAGRDRATALRGRNPECTPCDPGRRLYRVIGRGHASDLLVPITIFRAVGTVTSQMASNRRRLG